MTFVFAFTSFLLTVGCIWAFRRLAVHSHRLADIPNERSSHSVPVPRGAGIAIVLIVLGMFVVVSGRETDIAFVIAAGAIAAISFVDDLFSLPLLLRLAVHFGAAAGFVMASGSYNGVSLHFIDSSIEFGILGPLLSVLFVVWVTNAYNFMDGIDGIAGVQGFGTGIGWMLLGISFGITSYTSLGAIVAGSCAGFLFFNWHPAKVFMGDVGSTFLGFTFAVFPLIGGELRFSPAAGFSFSIILLWLFLFDSIYTRLVQLIGVQPFWRAHRGHVYQRLVNAGASHATVAAFFGSFAIAIALSMYLSGTLGSSPLILLLVAGPTTLLIWKHRLT